MSNAKKTNDVVKFIDIEKKVTSMTIGTKCTIAKYNDNKNGYIGIKNGRANIFSMYKLKNENTSNEFIIGMTDDIYNMLSKTDFSKNENVKLTANTNTGDNAKRFNNAIVNGIKTVYEIYQTVIDYLTKPQTATTETK